MTDLLSWLLSFFILVTTLGIVLYQLMCLADLELDYINPYDLASKINKVVMPEYISQGSLCVLHLLSGHWPMFLLCLPYLYYNATLILGAWYNFCEMKLSEAECDTIILCLYNIDLQYTRRQHLVDVTEIFNQLQLQKSQRIIKLGYLAILVILSIFWMIWSILDDDEEL